MSDSKAWQCEDCQQEQASQNSPTSCLKCLALQSMSSISAPPVSEISNVPVLPKVLKVSRSVSHAAPDTTQLLLHLIQNSIPDDGFHVEEINACSFLMPAWLDPGSAGGVTRTTVPLRHPDRQADDRPEPTDLRSFIMNSILELGLFTSAPSVRLPFGGVSRLLPLTTSPDGNCLLHALSLGMWGVHDRSGFLRRALHRFMSASPLIARMKELYVEQELADAMKTAQAHGVPPEFVITDPDAALSEWEFMLAESSKSGQQLASIHIFVMSHVLRRAILVHGPNELPQIDGQDAPNSVRGVYLPLLLPPEQCIKDPLVLYFQGDHFTALCRIDDQQPTPGLIQLDFIVEQVVRDSFGYGRTETSHEPLPLRYNAVKHTGLADELQMASYLDLQTVWAGLPGSTKTFYLQVARCSVRKTFWEWRHSEQNVEPVNNADVVHSLFGNHWHDYALAAEVQHEQKQAEKAVEQAKRRAETDELLRWKQQGFVMDDDYDTDSEDSEWTKQPKEKDLKKTTTDEFEFEFESLPDAPQDSMNTLDF